MRLSIVGATGGTGRELVEQALLRKHRADPKGVSRGSKRRSVS
jgi:hypothetical protein